MIHKQKPQIPLDSADSAKADTPLQLSVAAECESPNALTHRWHRVAVSGRARAAILAAVEGIRPPEWRKFFVRIVRVGPAKLDDDNLAAACKHVRDEIALWLGVDDGDEERVRFSYGQRQERHRDPSPRAKRKLRTWVDVTIAPTREGAGEAVPAGPPSPLIRERARADVRVDAGRTRPIRELVVGQLHVELLAWEGGDCVRVCKHYEQGGYMWRTAGVTIPMGDVEAIVAAIEAMRA